MYVCVCVASGVRWQRTVLQGGDAVAVLAVARPLSLVPQSVRALGDAVAGPPISLPLAPVALDDLTRAAGARHRRRRRVDLADKTRLRTLVAACRQPRTRRRRYSHLTLGSLTYTVALVAEWL